MSKVKLFTLAPSKPVEPGKNMRQIGGVETQLVMPKAFPLPDNTAMIYLTIGKPIDWIPPEWMINRKDYRKIMQGRGLRTEEYEASKWVSGSGEEKLPWTSEVDLSHLVEGLLDHELYVVSCETDIVELPKKGGKPKTRKVWIGFVIKALYEDPKAKEFKELKTKVLDWLERDAFIPSKRANVRIFFNPMTRTIGGIQEYATQIGITIDRIHARNAEKGGLNLRLRDGKLVLGKGPARR